MTRGSTSERIFWGALRTVNTMSTQSESKETPPAYYSDAFDDARPVKTVQRSEIERRLPTTPACQPQSSSLLG
jgi:hypothetical protein